MCRLNRHDEALTLLESRITRCSEATAEYVACLIYYARVYIELKQSENAFEVIKEVKSWVKLYLHRVKPSSDRIEIAKHYHTCLNLYGILLEEKANSSTTQE